MYGAQLEIRGFVRGNLYWSAGSRDKRRSFRLFYIDRNGRAVQKDKAFRIGGDEFVVVLHGAHDKKFYEGVIARMRQNVAREVVVGEITLNVSISAGYARCPEDGTKLEDVVKKADDAMYYNKRLMKARKGQTTER